MQKNVKYFFFAFFLFPGEKFLPELQRILYPDDATVHEAGLWQDAH